MSGRTRVRRAAIGLTLTAAMATGAGMAIAQINLPGGTPPPDQPAVTELPPALEAFSCRASSVRLAQDPDDPAAPRLEPFVANRDEVPCVDADSGAPSITQVPSDAAPGEPHLVVGAAYARTRDGDLAGDPEAPPPPETEDVVTAEAGVATVLGTMGTPEETIAATAVGSQASVTCEDDAGNPVGTPRFDSSSSIATLNLGGNPVTVQADDPATPDDESHIHITGPDGPIHVGHEEFRQEGDRTILIRRALWIENDGPEAVVGESKVDVVGNPCTGRLTVVKNAVPDGPQDFTFTGLPASPFVLDDDPASADVPRSRSFDLAPGAYTPTEQVPAGFQLRDVSCVGDSQAAPAPNGATVTLQRTEDVTCTFLNISDAVCSPGSVLNDQGQCVVTETRCPPDSTRNAAGECVVNTQVCPGGSTQQGNQCVSNETTCPAGSAFNAEGECVVLETECPAGSVENATGQCVSTQIVAEDVPRGGVVVPIDDVPGASRSRCSRRGFGRNVAIVGTNGPDRITGTNRSDRIFSFGGRDRVSGGRGNDCIEGGSGNDNLDGSNGGDALLGGTGRDILNGGTGRDRLEGATGNDKLTGGSGHDLMYGGRGIDKLSGGLGNDRLVGGPGRDYIDGGNGRDRVFGGAGNDAINVATEGRGRDIVNCGGGRDTVRATGDDRIARNCERVLIVRRRR